MDAYDFIGYLKSRPGYRGQIVHVENLPQREAHFAQLNAPLHPALQESLRQLGIQNLYSHQVEAVEIVRSGASVVVVTPTASGKTLCYNIPVLESVIHSPRARALYLFPTKALAQDQLRGLSELTGGASAELKRVRFGTYDGDTPGEIRGKLRKQSHIILSNPDMLHLGILPNHSAWESFFRHLKYVVIDEAHVYRGVFGSHVANVLRRLRRICRLYGSEPQFICCSATIANAKEHLEKLTGVGVQVIAQDGAPRGSKEFAFWNPPLIDPASALRRSANSEATFIFTELVQAGIRNITFTKARKVAELLLIYARNALGRAAPDLAPLISSYRAGYLAEDRRKIERDLFEGRLLGVTATNALELGVDIGSLDATVLVGYPGSVASTWQQAGRSGRGEAHSLSVLIGLDDPLDQYFMRHPENFFGRNHEHALIDPENPHILSKHLRCAAYEWPLDDADSAYFGPSFPNLTGQLLEQQQLARRFRGFTSTDQYPAQDVNIRTTSSETFEILDRSQGCRPIETIDTSTAFEQAHQGAIYLHQGETYVIEDFDLNLRVAYARPVDVDYYTQSLGKSDLEILECLRQRRIGEVTASFGRVKVTERVQSFKRKQQYTEVVLAEIPLDLPPQSFETMAVWFDVPSGVTRQILERKLDPLGGLHAIEHAAIAMLPFFAMCDRHDIGGLSTPFHPDIRLAAVFIREAVPGGTGIAEKGFELLEDLWKVALNMVKECPCEAGCPSCIQSPKCGNGNEPLDKEAAIIMLERILGV